MNEEEKHILLQSEALRVERIVSLGHKSAEGGWYDQEEEEWVMLVTGRAVIEFEHDLSQVELEPGGYLFIPAHRRHRVAWTAPNEMSIWLAVFPTKNRVQGGHSDI